jgi:UPF0755 protein
MNKKQVMVVFAVLLLTIFIIGIDGEGAAIMGEAEEFKEIIIHREENIDEIADKLKQNGIINSKRMFILYGKVFNRIDGVKYGLHKVIPAMGLRELYDELCVDRGLPTEIVKVTIPEGFNIRQIAKRLSDSGVVNEDEFLETAKSGKFEYWFLKDVPNLEDENYYWLEGFLFPATYEFNTNSRAEDVINIMLKRFDIALDPYRNHILETGKNVFDIIRIASIVEREAKIDAERPRIAGVFNNRLEIGMKLQSCATVQYLFDRQKPVVTLEDLKIDSPFNTYKYEGLPQGAISNPGDSSIKASLFPEDNDYLYFVAIGNTGEHKFAKTYEEHKDNIIKYRD